MRFRTLRSIKFQGPCCRDLNLGRLKIVFLESTFLCLLSMPDSCISLDDKKQVFTAACIVEQDVKVNTIIFEPFPAENDSDTTRNRT
jgi:hypothetical protein